jgi:hypothetical protein
VYQSAIKMSWVRSQTRYVKFFLALWLSNTLTERYTHSKLRYYCKVVVSFTSRPPYLQENLTGQRAAWDLLEVVDTILLCSESNIGCPPLTLSLQTTGSHCVLPRYQRIVLERVAFKDWTQTLLSSAHVINTFTYNLTYFSAAVLVYLIFKTTWIKKKRHEIKFGPQNYAVLCQVKRIVSHLKILS